MNDETRDVPDVIEKLAGGLVVSCQALDGSPMRDSYVMAKVAEAALMGGAVGLRVNGPEDIRAIRKVSEAPVIGLYKTMGKNRLIITPDFKKAAALVEAGASIVAVDATNEVLGEDFSLISRIRRELGVPVMADVSTVEEGIRAADAGADMVGSTLSGYTPETRPTPDLPDLGLVHVLAERGIRVVAEGRYRTPEQMSRAFQAGAYSVVIGGAITDPLKTSAIFVAATPRMNS
ncbi:N-acetylmannosamine-6-phosphate 2-epimerase [Actinomycetaceae bacterium MB13-C1-2]|nr:N-acetylmannosamine-6-phosphate 2-epimerase [Actinomycetaceae bacterium MB13-C1-2]